MAEAGGDRRYFAAFLDLRGRAAVVVGGGAVGEGKAESLLRSGARVTIVAPELRARLAQWAAAGTLAHRAKRFAREDLEGAALAIAATGDPRVNAEVALAARALGIPVNVADDPSLSSFIMPAIVDRGPVQIAISTGGASPLLATQIAEAVERALPAGYAGLAALAAEFRGEVKRRFADVAARRAFWQRVFDGPIARAALEGRTDEARALLERELAR